MSHFTGHGKPIDKTIRAARADLPWRLIILAGHYGSGKTHLAVNLALHMRRTHDRVAVADLDIVNPYYRTKDAGTLLQGAGIRLISSALAGSNLDAPSMSADAQVIFDDPGLYAVADVGGDDRGALALGRYATKIKDHPSCAALFVYNQRRPLTARVPDALDVLREIENAAHIAFAGLVNNTNIGPDTKPEDILESLPYADELSAACGLPVVLTSARRDMVPALEGKAENLFPIDIVHKTEWVL